MFYLLALLVCLSLLGLPSALRLRWNVGSVNRITVGIFLVLLAVVGAVLFQPTHQGKPEIEDIGTLALQVCAGFFALGELIALVVDSCKEAPVPALVLVPGPSERVVIPPEKVQVLMPAPKAQPQMSEAAKFVQAERNRKLRTWSSRNRGAYQPRF